MQRTGFWVRRAGWERYYRVIARIPRGRVATYGLIARLAGTPRAARQVGYALAALHGARGHGVPWHRVLGLRGRDHAGVSLADEDAERQRRLLAREGVRFDARGRVDLRRHGWVPR